jgi:hypothetical protein
MRSMPYESWNRGPLNFSDIEDSVGEPNEDD